MPLAEGILSLLNKEQLPAGEWDSADWIEQEPDFRARAFFSSRVENARFLDRAQGLIFDFLVGATEKVVGPDGVERTVLRVGARAQFVRKMRQFMVAEGMANPGEFEQANQGDLTDIRSEARLRLIFDTNVRQAYGFGRWKQGQKPAVLRRFPAARLIRERGVKEPRSRHQEHLGEVLLKSDPRWANFHNARDIGGFEVPWGPYGFGSGVDQEDVTREEAIELGLPVEEIKPLPGRLNDGLTMPSNSKMDPKLDEKLRVAIESRLKELAQARTPQQAARDAKRP